MSPILRIKDRWPLDAMLARCGITIPPRGKFCSPFRPDRNPSCERIGEKIRDWTTGENFDAIGVFAASQGIDNSEAIRRLASETGDARPQPARVKVAALQPAERLADERWPDVLTPTPRHLLEEIAFSRNLPLPGIAFAAYRLRTLHIAPKVCGELSWILSDRSMLGWEARRLDAATFPGIEGTNIGERKSHSRGKIKRWPMGILPPGIRDHELAGAHLLLVEGGPDYLAACNLALTAGGNVLPVAMLGKSSDIAPEALPLFRGRKVSIAGHEDAPDRIAKWAAQIRAAGASAVRPVQLGWRDLADLTAHEPETLHALAEALELPKP